MPTRSERKLWRSLRRRKGREASGLFLAEGPRLLSELLRASVTVERVLVSRDATHETPVDRLIEGVRARDWIVEEVEPRDVRELADTVTPQPVLAIVRIPSWGWPDVGSDSILLLDRVQDPGNLGTLLRTGAALGIGGVVCLPGTADPWSPKAVRSSAGAGLRVPVLRAVWEQAQNELLARALPLWAADAGGEPLERDHLAPSPLAIALGSEAHGLSDGVKRAADRTFAIRMAGAVESLNVAAAGAIILDRLLVGEHTLDRQEDAGQPNRGEA
jgi:TrmH family RNA methyltransferase